VLCLALLALLSVAQVTHTHADANDADHCQLCIILHSAAPAVAAAAPVALVQVECMVPVAKVRPLARLWHAQLFIRPPPAGSRA
jgi:acyl CoA:acetate/3-ketoacid CoA transferase alpha subunit